MRKLFLMASLFFLVLCSSGYALDITAASGSAKDIQTAVDQVAADGSGTVYIPEGDFVCDIDISLGPNPPPFNRPYAVLIPGGVSIIGQGIEKTILRQMAEPVSLGNMLIVDGRNGLQNRISGITFIGAPFTVEGEPAYTNGIYMHGATDFRIDHCHFENWSSKAISCTNTYQHAWGDNRGVIDHCSFDNPYKDDPNIEGAGSGGRKLWGYGIIPGGKGIDKPTDYYLGKYDGLEDIVYIEDCNFSRTRHAIASNSYGWYVVRNSKFYEPRPEHFGIIDVHGFNFGRGIEAYNNEIYGCEYQWNGTHEVPTDRWLSIGFSIRGGGGAIFNNSLIDINKGITLSDESPESGEGRIDDVWVWNNQMVTQDALPGYTGNDGIYIVPADFVEGEEYHLTSKPGYVPYTYPHPLTVDQDQLVNVEGQFSEPIESSITAYTENTDVVVNSDDVDNQGNYNLKLFPGIYDIQYNILKPDFFIPNFFLKVLSMNITSHIRNLIRSITEYPEGKKLSFEINITKPKIIKTYSPEKPKRVLLNGTSLIQVSSLSDLKTDTWFYDSVEKKIHMSITPIPVVTAASGYWSDIQDAVDEVATAGGGNVHIPAGDWNVVNVGETWTGFLINVPTNISVFGAPTQRDVEGMVLDYKTRLIIPWAASPERGSHGPMIFGFHGNEFGNDFTRISNIEFIGYNNPTHDWQTRRTYMIAAIGLDYVNEYRIDHIRTENMRGGGVKVWGREARGVIDHSSFENPVWYSEGAAMSDMDIGYGIAPSRIGFNFQTAREKLLGYWDMDDQNVLGKYTRYSHYIEDCYFTTWRHAIASNWGAHYVVRHSTFKDEYVFGTVDAHGWGFYGCYAPDGHWCYNRGPYDTYMAENYPDWTEQEKDNYWEVNKVVGWLGTRAFEVYNNIFEGPDPDRSHGSVVFARGGASVHFNNDIGLNSNGIKRYFEAGNEATWEEGWNRIWVWNNNFGQGISLNAPSSNPDISVVESKPNWYAPYTYPHPLTIED